MMQNGRLENGLELKMTQELKKALQAIADGHKYEIVSHPIDHEDIRHYVYVRNPDFKEDDGSDVYLTFEVKL